MAAGEGLGGPSSSQGAGGPAPLKPFHSSPRMKPLLAALHDLSTFVFLFILVVATATPATPLPSPWGPMLIRASPTTAFIRHSIRRWRCTRYHHHDHHHPPRRHYSVHPGLHGDGHPQQELLSLAPMMEYTDRHFRYLLRLISARMILYTEMVTAPTLKFNTAIREQLLEYNDGVEHPVVLQLGGADPSILAEACAIAQPYGYDAINLNCGCPSSKVAGSGCFGAALMREPALVASLCRSMGDSVGPNIPITVKCRIGVDDDDSYDALKAFITTVAEGSGVRHFVIHARKAILGGLSPEANRRVPPLRYDYVHRLTEDFPQLRFTLNGGVLSYEDVEAQLGKGVYGVMIGRAIVARPFYWADVDRRIFGAESNPGWTRREILEKYGVYAEGVEQREGLRLRRTLLKHVHQLFAGEPNGKRFRAVMDTMLLQHPDYGARQILDRCVKVLSDEVLDLTPGSATIQAPTAVRH